MIRWLAVSLLLRRICCEVNVSEYYSLRDLYYATNGPEWDYSQSSGAKWNFTGPGVSCAAVRDPCFEEWKGVGCDHNASLCQSRLCSVTSLSLGSFGLVGTIPSSVSSLANLELILFSSNRITSTLPSAIGELTALRYINIRENKIRGSIPESIGSLSLLSFLSIRDNCMTGSLPESMQMLSELKGLLVDYNYLSGPIPNIFQSMPKLEAFFATNNSLSGGIPSTIGLSDQITTLVLNKNKLTGTIPSGLTRLTRLQTLQLSWNQLEGALPADIDACKDLQVIDLIGNRFSRHIPASIGSLKKLTNLLLRSNQFSGQIPTSLGLLTVERLSLGSNCLTGTIPSEIFNPSLRFIGLDSNLLHGPIPDTSTARNLRSLGLADNFLSHSIPSTFALHSRLDTLHLSNNRITGTITSTIGLLSRLVDFTVDSNEMSGSIPNALMVPSMRMVLLNNNFFTGHLPDMSKVQALNILHADQNLLSGVIPTSIAALSFTTYLLLYDNFLSGSIPSELGGLSFLIQLQLQDNLLSGNPAVKFDGFMLETLDLSDNLFTGPVPPELFQNPAMTALVLSKNCFRGSLSSDMCYNESRLQMLLMDGLRSGYGCGDEFRVLGVISKTSQISQPMDGTVPDCLFSLPALKVADTLNKPVLNLGGNGFSGNVIEKIPLSSRITNLTLSHNRLTGSLTPQFQKWPFVYLDLSSNRLTGNLEHMKRLVLSEDQIDLLNLTSSNVSLSASTLLLKENRLSGLLPSNFRGAKNIDILKGNLFSCSNLPEHDPEYKTSSCGSSSLDSALISWAVMIPAVLLSAVVFNVVYVYLRYVQRRGIKENLVRGYYDFLQKQLSDVLKYTQSSSPSDSLKKTMPQLTLFIMLLYEMRRMALMITAYIVVVVGTVALVLKQHDDDTDGSWSGIYPTHVNQYSWWWSTVYIAGRNSAIIFASLWSFAMCYFVAIVCMHAWSRRQVNSASDTRVSALPTSHIHVSIASRLSVVAQRKNYLYLKVAVILIADFVVVFFVNASYVRVLFVEEVTRYELFFLQIGLTAFNVSWNKLMCVLLTGLLTPGGESTMKLQNFLLLLILLSNNVLAPVFSSVVIDTSCFRDLFVSMFDISSKYSYLQCQLFNLNENGDAICANYALEFFALSFSPSYTYNYECSSSVLSNFIPILFYVYLVQCILFPLMFAILSSVKYEKLPVLAKPFLPGFLWPLDAESTGRNLIPAAELLASTRSHIAVLLTFGMASPPLAMAIAFAIIVNIYRWQMYIGRYMEHSSFRASLFSLQSTRQSETILAILTSDSDIHQSDANEVHNSLHEDKLRKESNTEMVNVPRFSGLTPQPKHLSKIEDVESNLSKASSIKSSAHDDTITCCVNIENAVANMSQGYTACACLTLLVCCLFYSCLLIDMSGDEVGFESSLWVYITLSTITVVLSAVVMASGGYFGESSAL